LGSGGAVVDAWIPGAQCLRANTDGGTLRGGAPRVVWQALGADPRLISAHSAAERLDQEGRPPHLVWNPLSGDIAQLIPAVRAACLLGGPETLDHGPGSGGPAQLPAATNQQGRLCVQIGVLAWAREPFTEGPMHGVERILSWLHSWRVPWRWPAGRPVPFARAHTVERSRALWSTGGHYGASQIPGWDAAGPGNIDIELLGMARVTPCQAISRHRKTRPAVVNRNHRVSLEKVLGPEIDADAAVASLASAPY
jgi:hypothetical protein